MLGKRWKASVFALVGVLLVLTLGAIGALKTASRSGQVDVHDMQVTPELVASTRICQTFVPEYPALSRVSVYLATYGRSNQGPLVFSLRSAPDEAQALYSLTLDASEVKDNAHHDFAFPSLRDSQGRALSFCLEAPEGRGKNAVGVWGTPEDTYENGQAQFYGVPDRGIRDLVFELDYRFAFPQTVISVVHRLAEYKPAWWGSVWIYVCLGAIYLVLLCWLLFKFVRTADQNG
jgi:hypothetical protein